MTTRALPVRPSRKAKPIDMAGLPDSVGFMLRLAQVAVFQKVMAGLKRLDLRVSDFSILLIIGANEGLKQQDVGEALSIKRANLVSIIDNLVKRGLVDRTVPETDKRSYSLSLTQAGKSLLQEANAVHDANEAQLASHLGGEHKHLIDELRRIVDGYE